MRAFNGFSENEKTKKIKIRMPEWLINVLSDAAAKRDIPIDHLICFILNEKINQIYEQVKNETKKNN
jgi:hypothetical protein